MESFDVADVKEKLEEVIELSVKNALHIRIASEKGSVVLLPAETYDNLVVTLELLSTPGLMDTLQMTQTGSE